MNSALYFGTVRHRRFFPRRRDFSYRVYMVYLDLDERDAFFGRRWLWSDEGANLVSFRRRDYLGDSRQPLDESVRDEAERATGRRPTGPVRMLTNLRNVGYVFNPVTFYWTHRQDGAPHALIAEITNTPWRERHRYVLPLDERGAVDGAAFDKAFHISPFQPFEQEYRWAFSPVSDRIGVHMENREGGEVVFDATLSLERREASARTCAWALCRHPMMGGVAHLAIYWQALRLKLKRTPFYRHPAKSNKAADDLDPRMDSRPHRRIAPDRGDGLRADEPPADLESAGTAAGGGPDRAVAGRDGGDLR